MKAPLVQSTAALSLAVYSMLATSSVPVAATQCGLTAADLKSLELSPSHIKSQAEVDALPDKDREDLCITRAKWNRIKSSGQFQQDDFSYSQQYLTPEEWHAYAKFANARLKAILSKTSEEEWNRFRQKWIKEFNGH
jgi:hypothetical protein